MSDTETGLRRESPAPVERERDRERDREPRGRDRRSDDIRSLFVRGLAAGTRAEDLTSAFETYGAVRDVYIPKDYYSGGIKGFAYIQYASQEEADKAFDKIEYLTINGRRLTVEWAQGDRKSMYYDCCVA
ncbi:UNVERIFIED_CONTAM: Arginine/serine-rich splicing factor scl25a transcript I [Siphonaria sp. JEL0065]|nr:Arginine/serine-rich splicing factor scl25a transcript I [Siphonaria sp. JEL0065]